MVMRENCISEHIITVNSENCDATILRQQGVIWEKAINQGFQMLIFVKKLAR